MVDTPKAGDGDEKTEDDPSKKQPKRRCQRRRSKSRQSKNGESGTGDNNTPDSAEDNPLQQDSAQEDEGANPHERAADREVKDDNYVPPSEDEASLNDDEFVVPEDPVEQKRFQCRLKVLLFDGILRHDKFVVVEACLVFGGRHIIVVLDLSICRSLMRAGFLILLR